MISGQNEDRIFMFEKKLNLCSGKESLVSTRGSNTYILTIFSLDRLYQSMFHFHFVAGLIQFVIVETTLHFYQKENGDRACNTPNGLMRKNITSLFTNIILTRKKIWHFLLMDSNNLLFPNNRLQFR